MSFEIGHESLPRRVRRSSNLAADYYGLGATAVAATAPWMVGLPGPGDSKDNTRIAYAKRDHDLALRGDATAYANLKGQAAGSATKVGKAWYNAALNDVNAARLASAAPAVRATPIAPPTTVNVNPIPLVMPVLRAIPVPPIVKQATDMGLKIQQTTDGSVVAVNSDGAVVSKPLPVPVSAVTDNSIVPPNAVQANAPPQPRVPGVFSILDRLTETFSAPTSSSSFIPSQGPPVPGAAPTTPAPDTPTGDAMSDLFKNPTILIAAAALIGILFLTGSGGRHR
jgi:hypothetical protein